ncbi:MAG: methionyl-tRNA formyltransferase, partial [Candidatus Rokuibacteriota bacterium]
TQPDKPAGRGRAVTPSPVKRRALAASVPVLLPPRLRDAGWPERLAEYRSDVAEVAAIGQILP